MSIVLFAILAVVAVGAAAGLILSRRPIHSALFLLLNFATLAVMYIGLNAQFLAAAQVIVYAGAIVVLFLFVIMLIGWQANETIAPGRLWTRYLAVFLGVLLLVALVYALAVPPPAATQAGAPDGGSAQAVGAALFTSYLLPFELTSVLILVGIVGAIVLSRKPSAG